MKIRTLILGSFLLISAIAYADEIKQGDCTWASKHSNGKIELPNSKYNCWYGTDESEKMYVKADQVLLKNIFKNASIKKLGNYDKTKTNLFYGYAGNDILMGGNSVDWFYGGSGNDTIYLTSSDYAFGQEGLDTFKPSFVTFKANIKDLTSNYKLLDASHGFSVVEYNPEPTNVQNASVDMRCPCGWETRYNDDGVSYLGNQYTYCPCNDDKHSSDLEQETAH